VTFKNDCYDTVLGNPSFTLTTYTQDLWNEGTFTFTPPSSTKANCAEYTYRLLYSNDDVVPTYGVNVDNPLAPFVVGTPSDKAYWTN